MGTQTEVTRAVDTGLVGTAGGADSPEGPTEMVTCGGAVAFDA